MTIADIATIVTMVGVFFAIIYNKKNNDRQDSGIVQEETRFKTTVESDIKHIRTSVDKVSITQDNQGKDIKDVTERLIKTEQSARQAHKRIDTIEQKYGFEIRSSLHEN